MNPSQKQIYRDRSSSRGQWLSLLWVMSLFFTMSLRGSPGPVVLWRGDGNANDSVGTNHGVLVNGTTFAPGIAVGEGGQAFAFDGSNDEVRFANSADFNLTNAVTVAGWLRTPGTAEFSGLVDKFTQAGQTAGFQVTMSGNNGFPPNQSGILRSDFGVGNAYVTAFNPRLVADGVPHHFAVTCDGQQAILYVDGLAGSPVVVTNWATTNSADIVLGNDTDASGRHFTGQLDEVAIYARALSASEVQALAGQPPLQIVVSAPGQATLSWPQIVSGFRLQTNETVAPTGWGNAASGTNNPVIVTTPFAAKFYRLTKP